MKHLTLNLQRWLWAMSWMMLCTTAYSQDIKIGFVDTARVLSEAPQAATARKKLENEFAPRDQKIVDMQTELKKLDEQLSREGGMTDGARKRLERSVQSLKRDIKRSREEFIEDFNLRRNDEIIKLQDIIGKITIDIAREENFDLILRDNVLFSSKRIDITDKVLERLRLQHKAEKGKPDAAGSGGN